MLRVRMASFSHELLNSSHDPVCKTGRDRVLNPLESGFSHELPDNDTDGRRRWAGRGGNRGLPKTQGLSGETPLYLEFQPNLLTKLHDRDQEGVTAEPGYR